MSVRILLVALPVQTLNGWEGQGTAPPCLQEKETIYFIRLFFMMHLYVHFQVIQVVTGSILKTSPRVSSATKIHRASVLRASFPTWP